MNYLFSTIFSVYYLAALAKAFLALGALGSVTSDLAASSNLLDAVDVFLRLRTILSLAASSYKIHGL